MARTCLAVPVTLSLLWGQTAKSLPTDPIVASLCPKARPWEPSPLPERWYQALISQVAAASRITGDLSQAVALVFAGGDTVTMNHPGEDRERGRGCSPVGWHQSCSRHCACPAVGLLQPPRPKAMAVPAPTAQRYSAVDVQSPLTSQAAPTYPGRCPRCGLSRAPCPRWPGWLDPAPI